jgi:hypothetical protein
VISGARRGSRSSALRSAADSRRLPRVASRAGCSGAAPAQQRRAARVVGPLTQLRSPRARNSLSHEAELDYTTTSAGSGSGIQI